ncbi:bifunctional hydroxymethylpyrimidine kinase/phosphomethylpyrimidine kinase [Bacillus niameyensis]|uniref:bifunctional hydroxymethylpyrimidine kinase/phosphomethylpyrimidine kinase n=1 Tax=Bacillus niameyensis TaxID=1522308 RepID=UPI00078663B4|nr:bifunctional hydroxymethylpyrimidine kinase/phosphomethylpyrimidine kinase [Bacillus niameyensis]
MTNVAMTIAGSDSGGGAGIQADLKTFQELGVFGTSALTAVTAQNTLGVHDVFPIDPNGVKAQIQAIMDDFHVRAIKTGMLFSANIIYEVASILKEYESPAIIIDPVMVAKGGASLLQEESIQALNQHLLPMATVVTPNIPEAEILADMKIENDCDVEEAGKRLLNMGAKAVVMKGGHLKNKTYSEDLFLAADGTRFTLRSKRIHTEDTHGTGCTFSAAIAAFMAKGKSVQNAVVEAKIFIHAAIGNGLNLGNGHGPTNHWAYRLHGEKARKDVIIVE